MLILRDDYELCFTCTTRHREKSESTTTQIRVETTRRRFAQEVDGI